MKAKGTMTVGEAGRKGGTKTAATHDTAFYSRIGKMGGAKRKEQIGEEGYYRLGKKGGKKTALTHGSEFYSRIGSLGGKTRAERG